MARILSPVVHHKPLTCVSNQKGPKASCSIQAKSKSGKGVGVNALWGNAKAPVCHAPGGVQTGLSEPVMNSKN